MTMARNENKMKFGVKMFEFIQISNSTYFFIFSRLKSNFNYMYWEKLNTLEKTLPTLHEHASPQDNTNTYEN